MNNQKAKILVVEDNKTIQNLMKKTLNLINYESTIVKNGLQAVEILADNYFDLIFLDLEMPLMDGISCIQNIRSLPDNKKANIPVVSVTGNALDLSTQEFEQLGFTDVVFKPVDFRKLEKILKKYLPE